MINDYQTVSSSEDVLSFCQSVKRERSTDIEDWNNLTKRFIKGRKVNKIPATSSDVTSEDILGDINYTTSFLYILVYDSVNNVNVWRRLALGAF